MKDIVYILKSDAGAEELRHSLRSLENLPHGDVWFFCGCPEGITPDHYVPFQQAGTNNWQRSTSTLRTICATEEISETFWLFNDDFFILKPLADIPYMYAGTLAQRVADLRSKYVWSNYAKQLDQTRQELEARGLTSLNYALHIPMKIQKKKALETLDTFRGLPMFRSLYGNQHRVGGIDLPDVKIYDRETIPSPEQVLLSTSDDSFEHGAVGRYIRERFTKKSKWEE